MHLGEVLHLHLLLLPLVQRQRHHGVLNRVFRHKTDGGAGDIGHLHVASRTATEDLRHLLVDLLVLLHPAVLASEEVEGVRGFVLRDQRSAGHRAIDPVQRNSDTSFPKEVQVEFKVMADPQIHTLFVDQVVEPLDHAGVGANVPISL